MDNLNNTIESIVSPLTAVYNKIEEKGGEIPAEKNMKNLGPAIRSIPQDPFMGQYGKLYTTDYPDGIKIDTKTEYNALQVSYGSKIQTNVGRIEPDSVTGFEFNSNIGKLVNYVPVLFLANCSYLNSPINIPEGISTIRPAFLQQCMRFNSTITLPQSLTTIDNSFMQYCSNFNQPLILPTANPLIIGYAFLRNCDGFNQPLTLPANITSINANWFMFATSNFLAPLKVECPISVLSDTDREWALSATIKGTPDLTTGHTLTGTYASSWKSALPNRTSSPYRKLILG